MKKWETPKVEVLSLDKTEVNGYEPINCSKCDSNIETFAIETITCYKCTCCPAEFHMKDYTSYPGEALYEAQQHALKCICSS